jgi:haloalkane dehalogenase
VLTEMPARPAWVPSDLYPFADHWAEIDGHLVHYVDEGTGPTLLFLNGNPSWSFGWRDVIARLAPTFRCVAPDYPGFGLSVARPGFDCKPPSQSMVVERLVDQLGLTELTPVMYDWGGPIGLGLAGRRPELIRALVIGNTWGWPMKSLSTRMFSTLFGGPLGPLLVDRLNLILRLFLPLSLKRAKLTPAEKAAYAGPFPGGRRATMRVFPREIVAGRAAIRAVQENLARLTAKPTLLLWADGSVGLGGDVLARWQALFQAARTVPLVKVGRYLDEDAPDDIADAILTWWAEAIEPATPTPPAPAARRTRPSGRSAPRS